MRQFPAEGWVHVKGGRAGCSALGESKRITAKEIEEVIRSLSAVISARVVADSSGTIQEIHVLSDSSRLPKQIVRDVESALSAQFGLEVDHKKISVAQTQDGKQFRFSENRLKLADVSVSTDGTRIEAVVRLLKNGDICVGRASGQGSIHHQMRLIAISTLRAVENCEESDGSLVLEDLSTEVTLSGKQIVVVCVSAVTPRGEDLLTGSAVVKQDLWKAIVNATLNSVNRRLPALCNGRNGQFEPNKAES